MDIKHFSELVGLSAHTIRYYEKIDLLRGIKRDSGGRRYFTEHDVRWVQFIVRLKETGMPLKSIKQYSDLRHQGDSTLTARKELLEQHRNHLKAELEKQQNHLSALDAKITYYQGEIDA
ncbi:MerR family transcriptional regulator [Vibrio sp. M260118]|uniref:MerR family transcriptional regulator n=1 Tax=Vibrio sp. M260118 TaxID=3020896 RepID=UPI002F3EF24C